MSALFAMVAGAVLLARAIEVAPFKFVMQRFRRLLPAVIFWSCFYFWWRSVKGEKLSLESISRDLAYGMPSFHLWFLFVMLGLYALLPALRLIVRDEHVKSTQYLTALIFAIGTCITVINNTALQHYPSVFFAYTPLLVVYVIYGYLIYRDEDSLPIKRPWIWAVCCIVGTMLIVRTLEPANSTLAATFIQSLRAPIALGWVLAFFFYLLRLGVPSILSNVTKRLAPVTLGIYALHPFLST